MARRGSRSGLFYSPPRHRKLAQIVTFSSVGAAERAARQLVKMFEKAKSRDRKRVIKSATVLAANRAKAMLRRRDLSPAERKKYRALVRIYRAAAAKMEMPKRRR